MTRRFFFSRYLIFVFSCLLTGLAIAPRAFAVELDANSELSQEQKAEKRLLFSQYVNEEIAKSRKRQADQQAAGAVKNWVMRFSNSYGYDSNVGLDSSRRGDAYSESTAYGSIKWDRPDLALIPSNGKISVEVYDDWVNYENYERFRYNIVTVTAADEETISDRLALRLPVEFSVVDYPTNHGLTYFSYRFKPTITHVLTPMLAHLPYSLIEMKDFKYLPSLFANGLNDPDLDRKDYYYEAGESLRFVPGQNTFMGLTAGWKSNDANDLFNDYNDYEGWKLSGFAYQKIYKGLSVVGYTGYDFKKYDSRVFETTSSRTEEHDFYYVGGTMTIELNKTLSVYVNYLYKQNNCNNPALEYTGWSSSAGLAMNF